MNRFWQGLSQCHKNKEAALTFFQGNGDGGNIIESRNGRDKRL